VAVVTRLIEPILMSVIGLVIGVIVVLMYFPIFQLRGVPMNAAVDEVARSLRQCCCRTCCCTGGVPNSATLDEVAIARAMREAEEQGAGVREYLSRSSGLSGAAYARALATAFDYRSYPIRKLARCEA